MGYSADYFKKRQKMLKAKEKRLDKSLTDDIAPVRKDRGGNDDSWFKSGAFDDGYQFGDITKTKLGTTADLLVGAVKGVGRMVEGVVDLGTYGVAGVADLFGADEFAEKTKKVAQYSATDEWTKPVTDAVDQWSVLGNKADAVSEGIGQVAAIILTGGAASALAGGGAAGALAASIATTSATGLSAMGSGMSEAYASGATDKEAATYGLISGIAEAGTEMLFGGLGKAVGAVGLSKGITSIDDAFAKKVSSKIANQTLKNFTEFGIKAGAEGTEEVASGILQAIGKKMTYMSEEELVDIVKDEKLLDQFIVGTITSGIAQSGVVPGMKNGSLLQANKDGADFITGYTKTEQTVVDKLVEQEIAEKEKKLGRELKAKERTEIEEAIDTKMRKGYIDTSTIEDILGGESSTEYKSTVDKETALKQEIEALEGMADNSITVKQRERLAEARKQLEGLDTKTAKAKMSEDVLGIVKGDRNGKGSILMESYNEVERKKQKFNVDLAKVKNNDTYKRALESGVLNNTNRSHDFVDFISKLEAKSGTQFDFTNNKKLAEAGYSVDGAVINGMVVNGKVSLNVNSSKGLETIVGHEITHVLEGTELYTTMRETILEYAKSKGDYQGRLDTLTSLYKDVEDVDIEGELTADLVGDYLFTDEKFLNNLVANKNVFQKVWDEIKYMVKMATKGSEEEKKLLELQRSFEKAFQNSKENVRVSATDSIQYNLAAVADHKAKLNEEYSVDASVDLETLTERYDKIVGIWEKLGGKLDSKFLKEWDAKKGKDRAFSVFKKQDGYKYNLELSTLCKKGVPLFEAIDQIVKKEVMDQLNTDTIGKAEKEILYDILKDHHFEIPCAICYVEQARQREGVIINNFLNGNTDGKLGWNQVLTDVQELMKKSGVEYKFQNVDRSIATSAYSPSAINMTEQEQDAFFSAIMELANKEISKLNADPKVKTKRSLIKEATPQAISEALKGRINQNLGIFKVLAQNPDQRFMIDRDLLLSSETSSNLTRTHNALYGLFNQQGGVSGYKTKQSAVVYWGDLLSTKWDTTKLRNEGGMRNQSNSDFQMYTLLDQAQMYMDSTAKGYTLHAYTKVLSELKLFGLSRGKINASLIPKVKIYYNADGTVDVERTMATAGLDENGDLFFDDIEGINHDEAFMLIEDEEYSKNIGGICIGYSDAHIQKLLDDNRVQLIIGFHDKTNDIDKRYRGAKYAKNYRGINEAQSADGKSVHIKFGSFLKKAENLFGYNTKTETFGKESATFNGKTYSVNDIPKLAADMYLKHCATKGLSPAYSVGGINFSDHENYYKLLADYSLYDSQGNYAPQRKVAYEMPDQVPYLDGNGVKQYMDTETFIENELSKEMALRDSISDALADTSDEGIIPQFINKVNELHSEKKQYSLSGVNSKTADMGALAKAESMLEQGADSETIRQDTGWFKSYDGKWRYEIDDSKAVWHIKDAEPDKERLFNFGERIYKLGDLLDHEELYEAYPQLRDVTVWVNPYAPTSGYVVGRNTDSFVLRNLDDSKTTKWTIIHETQHLIQNIEGFARGSSKNEFTQKEWGDKEYDAFEKRNEVAKKLYNVLRRNGVSISNDAIYEEQNYGYGYKVSDEIIESNYWTLRTLADGNKRTEALLDEYYEQVQILNATTPEGQYHLTAGEIEANDTMARMDYSAEKRKATRPNVDNPNVVFANGDGNSSMAIVTLDNGKQYVRASEKQVIQGNDSSLWANQVALFINEELRNWSDFEIQTIEGDVLTLTRDTAYKAGNRDAIKNPDGSYRQMTDAEYLTKLNAEIHINELAEASKKQNRPLAADTKNHRFAKDGFSYRTAYFQDYDGEYYRVTISIGHNGDVATIYNVGKIKKDALPNGKIKSVTSGLKPNNTSSYDNSIAPLGENVKRDEEISAKENYSLSAEDDLAPVGKYTNLSLEEDIAPIKEDNVNKNVDNVNNNVDALSDVENVDNPVDDIAPVREDATPITKAKKDKLTTDIEKIEEKYTNGKDVLVSEKAQTLYDEVNSMHKGKRVSTELGDILNRLEITEENKTDSYRKLRTALLNINKKPNEMVNTNPGNENYVVEQMVREQIDQSITKEAEQARQDAKKESERVRRKDLHNDIIDRIKESFSENGLDFDKVLKNGKRMHTLSINDNTPQRVNDKTFGYREGELLNELTFNQVARNESNGIKWLNGQVDTIRNLSKKYHIKPRSKESKAAQMYAEGFYVNKDGDLIKYGDAELAKDFHNVNVQNNIKGLANDAEVRRMYDETLTAINESRVRNGYPEIPKRKDYFLHFRAMDDTFSRLGIPFNPNDIKAKDLPTDINGMTADLKPGQPYFASANRRMGNKTTYDLLGGIERYMNSAKNQIYHIDDIQTARALRNYIADQYGQANGLSNLDELTPEEQEQRIKDVFDGHLSNYAKFLNEYANNLAGKTSLIDRGVEGLVGRRAIQALKTFNSQVSRNMVGFNVASAGTNTLSMVQAFAKMPKRDIIKGFSQTVANRFHKDGFAEQNEMLIRRKGIDKFSTTPWEKVSDAGYYLMGAVDNFSSEVIVRGKYNELVRKGMDSEQAHIKAGEWASRILGDRSLGQLPMHYNSAIAGLFTKFQLEVRNQLDSMGYDTIQEAKASTDSNVKRALKITTTMAELAIFQHMFGMAYESIAGYNPAFDIVSTIATLFGWDDEEESEDTFGDNAQQAWMELLGDLPYTNLFTDGGRIPISDAFPIDQLVTGEDEWGNEVSRMGTLAEAVPYLLPGGWSQIKKTSQGLNMFSDEHPVAGSYTDSGDLRFPVEDTFGNRLQAGLFGQYASKNAREYFDNDYAPMSPKQVEEYADVGMSYSDYQKYRKGLNKLKTVEEKFNYINSLNLTTAQKNILVNNVVDRKNPVDMTNYGRYGSYEEFEFASKYPAMHLIARMVGGYDDYVSYVSEMSDIAADKSASGNTISGSRKKKIVAYLNSLDISGMERILLFKSAYPNDTKFNRKVVEYVKGRTDLTRDQKIAVLEELGMRVGKDGKITW